MHVWEWAMDREMSATAQLTKGADPLGASSNSHKVTKKHRFRNVLFAGVVLIGMTAAGLLFHFWNRSAAEYITANADRGDIDSTVTTTGNLNAVITVQVGSQVSGKHYGALCRLQHQSKEGPVGRAD